MKGWKRVTVAGASAGPVEPAAQTSFIMVCRVGRLIKPMQADRGINHVSSGQGGEVEVRN